MEKHAVIIVFALAKVFGNKKETNSDAYSAKDVAYTCTKDIEKNGNKGTISADVVYNDNGYQTTVYYKMVVKYAEMNDEKMLSLLKDIGPYGGTKLISLM